MLKLTRLQGHSKEKICVARIDHSSWNGQCNCYVGHNFSRKRCTQLGQKLATPQLRCEKAVFQLSFVAGAEDGDSL